MKKLGACLKKSRINKHQYFMNIAEMTALRSTCDRAMVGAILVKDSRIIATGYNGAPSDMPHCETNNHLIKDNHCRNTIHGEINCIIQAAILGISVKDSVLYVTHKPCFRCCQVLINAGILRVYYIHEYTDDLNYLYAKKLQMVKLNGK